MEPLKEMFNRPFYEKLAKELRKAESGFNSAGFLSEVTLGIAELSLNQRMRNTSHVLKRHLPDDFGKAIGILKKVIPNMNGGYTNLLFPDYVGVHGLDHFDQSMEALKYFTTYGSSEFAVREFLKLDFNRAIKIMNRWAEDKNHHVRRLASEGSRPRLPWSFKLDEVIKHPHRTQPILELLKADPELYVRKSVANHLNDVSKENSAYMLKLINAWDKSNPHTAWIVKHASRTLIKKGDASSLLVFGFEKNVKVEVKNFKLNKGKLKLGETLKFEFELLSRHKTKSQKLVVDYVIHYVKSSGQLLPKVFKLKEIDLLPSGSEHIQKSQVFKDFTTRKHYRGQHFVELKVNGKSFGKTAFNLV